MFLTNHVLVEDGFDLLRHRQLAGLTGLGGFRNLFANDVVAELDTLVADEYGRASDQLAYFVLALATE